MNIDKKRFHYQLEKEAHISGVSIGQSIGIDIPPPRPRRKPSNPYLWKSSSAPSTWATSYAGTKDERSLSSASSSHCKRIVDLEIKPLHEVIVFIIYVSNITNKKITVPLFLQQTIMPYLHG
ncbi:hypothetical protein TB1_000998 [Malus domestica]